MKTFPRKWILKINVAKEFHKYTDEEVEYNERIFKATRNAVTTKLEKYDTIVKRRLGEKIWGKFLDLVDALKYADNLQEFNDYWDELYDWGDLYDVWIDTH